MKKTKECLFFVVAIILFFVGFITSLVFEVYPTASQKSAVLYNAKKLLSNAYFVSGVVNTYIRALIPVVIFLGVLIVVALLFKNKLSRKIFYMIGFWGCGLSGLTLLLISRRYSGLPEYYYAIAGTLTTPYSSWDNMMTANLVSIILVAFLLSAVTMFVVWILEQMSAKFKK